jgi:hypothetical protein
MRIPTRKLTAAAATIALLTPAAALAGPKDAGKAKGKATAPGQVCKSLKVKGKKTAEQKAAFAKCISDAAAAKAKPPVVEPPVAPPVEPPVEAPAA